MMMELSVQERLVLITYVVPKQGNVATFRVIDELRGSIGFKDDEVLKWTPTQTYDLSGGCPRCGGVEWNNLPFTPIQECVSCKFLAGRGAPGGWVWRQLDDKAEPLDQMAEIEIGDAGLELIRDTLRLYNTNNELNGDLIGLYRKFVGEAQDSIPPGVGS